MALLCCRSPRSTVDGSSITCLPEEVLQQILLPCVSATLTSLVRPSWHTRQKSTTTIPNRSRGAALLVCKLWLRIATPLFYHSLVLPNEESVTFCARTLLVNSSLGYYVRNLVVMGVWVALGDVIKLCPAMESLDLTLDAPRISYIKSQLERDTMVLCYLRGLDIKHFVLRKQSNAYLTQHKPRFAALCLSLIIPTWQQLVSKYFVVSPAETHQGSYPPANRPYCLSDFGRLGCNSLSRNRNCMLSKSQNPTHTAPNGLESRSADYR
jgi:hypothetical protein